MNYFIKNNDMIMIKKYENILFHHTPKQITSLYENYIYNSLKNTGLREFYREVAYYLKAIAKYNHAKAQEIYDTLILKYPKRPAMIEELKLK